MSLSRAALFLAVVLEHRAHASDHSPRVAGRDDVLQGGPRLQVRVWACEEAQACTGLCEIAASG